MRQRSWCSRRCGAGRWGSVTPASRKRPRATRPHRQSKRLWLSVSKRAAHVRLAMSMLQIPPDFLAHLPYRSRRTWCEVDCIPSLLEAPCEMLDTLTLPEPVTRGGAEFPRRLVADEDSKHTDQDGVSDCDHRTLLPPACGQPAERRHIFWLEMVKRLKDRRGKIIQPIDLHRFLPPTCAPAYYILGWTCASAYHVLRMRGRFARPRTIF